MTRNHSGSNNPRYTHGLSKSGGAEYRTWTHMRGRCLTPTDKKYPRYGGRGIKICERWARFENFLFDMGRRPSPQHSIERLNNDGDYEPSNCVWATPKRQAQNMSRNRLLTFQGETAPMCAWADRFGILRSSFQARLNRGWPIERALTEPPRPLRRVKLSEAEMRSLASLPGNGRVIAGQYSLGKDSIYRWRKDYGIGRMGRQS